MTNSTEFQSLYEAFRKPIFLFLRRSTSSEEIALDLMQDVFLNFIRIFQERKLPDEDQCRMYLFRTARNILINYYKSAYNRKVSLTENVENMPVSSLEDTSFIDSDEQRQAMQTFNKLLLHLNDTERQALLLRYEHDMTIEQVAEVLELSLTTAFRVIKKAKQQLVEEGKKIGFDPSNFNQ